MGSGARGHARRTRGDHNIQSGSAQSPPQVSRSGVCLTPRRPGDLPLLLLEREVPTGSGDATLAVLDVGVSDPGVVVASLPDCGCDACDAGSIDFLEAIDSTISHVVGDPFVVLSGKRWRAQWHPQGGTASNEGRGPSFEHVMDLCHRLADGQRVRLPRHTEALVGHSWLV